MAQALNPARVTGTAAQASTGPAQVLLASCKATLYVLRNQQWEALFDSSVFRVQLLRLGPGSFVLLAVDEQTLVVKVKISLRFNTVFKVIKNNFFSLLDNGVTVWAFDITGQPMDAQTFAIVIQNSLASLKELHINKTNRPTLPTATQPTQPTLPRQEMKGDQQIYLNNICLTLSDAINRGNEQFASDLARQLASHKALVRIKLDDPEKEELAKATKDNKLNLKVQVEDKESTGCHFRLNIAPQTTINQLKQMVQTKYEFPAEIQRWIIGKRLPKPSESLLDCGIKTSGSTLFLYLISDKAAAGAEAPPESRIGDDRRAPMLNRINEPNLANVPALIQQGQRELQYDQVQDVYGIARNMLQSMPNIPSVRIRQPVAEAPEDLVGWVCSQCTFRNSPTRPGCEMCSANRPADYQVPEDYMPNQRERERLQFERSGEMLMREEDERKKRREMEERDRNFQRLLSIVDQPLIESQEDFQCPICFDDVEAGEGVVLRECLHNFCRDCLTEHIRASTEPEVQCPFDNGDFACHDIITPQEIQELLTPEDFQKYLQRSLVTAESRAPNSFHCQTPNCHGWCIYDDEVNEFDCPVCNKKNCLTCKAIHHPTNCKEYQDDLKRNAANDEAARKTQEYLEEMLRTKDGMNCPCCGIILVKKDGCDWMKCSMCKTEICWAVRGLRWGPGGPGDTNGGCKCRINNAKCHPDCRNCH